MKAEIIDISDFKSEFEKLRQREALLSDRFIAIAMDYKHYIDASFKENKIYELRDNIQYRLFSARIHVEAILRQHVIIQKKLEKQFKENPQTVVGNFFPFNPYFLIYHQEISSLFDSFIYHSVSVFDYLSTLTNYISGQKKDDTLMWTQLAKSVRADNHFSKKSFAKVFDKIDRGFVFKLNEHRSFLIHKRSDLGGYNFTLHIGGNQNIQATFLSGKNFIRTFKELKEQCNGKHPTIKYSTFWILNKTFDKVTELLFALKNEMELNPKVRNPSMFTLDPDSGVKLPISKRYWHEELLKK